MGTDGEPTFIGFGGCLSLNVAGGLNPINSIELKNMFKLYNIVGVQEVHGEDGDETAKMGQLGFTNGAFSFDINSRARAGTGIMWRDEISQIGNRTWKDAAGRIVCVGLEAQGVKMIVASVHAPCLAASEAAQNAYVNFLIGLQRYVQEAQAALGVEHVLLLGDFNIIFDSELDSFSTTPRIYSSPREALLELLFELGVTDAFRWLRPEERTYSFSPGQGSDTRQKDGKPITYNRIDYIFVPDKAVGEISEANYLPKRCSDHRAVTASFGGIQDQGRTRGLWRHNDLLNTDPEFIQGATERVRQAMEEAESLSHQGRFELVKYRLGQFSRKISIERARKERKRKNFLMEKLAEASPVTDHIQIENWELELNQIIKTEGERIIFRAKVDWVEYGERCTSYFLRASKANRAKSNIEKLRIDGEEVTNTKKIDTTIRDHFEAAFKKEEVYPSEEWARDLPRINPRESEAMGRPITMGELHKSLTKSMNPGKSPGNDGLTVGLFKALWAALKDPYYLSLREGIEKGQMGTSQRQSVIRLIQKKDKDPLELRNWRPISLMNVDAKIYAKALADRITPLLPQIISDSQNAFVKGRNIHDGIRTIDQAISHLERREEKGGILAVDFSKAFDTIDHSYLWDTMANFGISQNFIHMVQTLYNGAESAVLNGGNTLGYTPLQRSCRQGDPISPYLFIVAIEPLIRKINQSTEGIKTPGGKVGTNGFADDINSGLKHEEDLRTSLGCIERFGEASGLRINLDKCELMLFGEWESEATLAPEIKRVDMIKFTGVYLGKAELQEQIDAQNFDPVITKLERTLLAWKTRQLSLVGRITIVKTLGLSQIQYLANSTVVPPGVVKKVTSLVASFFWGAGTDKISRVRAARKWEDGGMNMPEVRDVISAAAIHWFRRAYVHSDSTWARNIHWELNRIGGNNAGNCHRDKRTRDEAYPTLSRHTAYIVEQWGSLVDAKEMCRANGITEKSPIWFNPALKKAVTMRKRSTMKPLQPVRLKKYGILTVGDMMQEDGTLMGSKEAIRRGLPPIAGIEWDGIVTIIKKKGYQKSQRSYERIDPNFDVCTPKSPPVMIFNNKTLGVEDLTQSKILRAKADTGPPHQTKFQLKLTDMLGLTPDNWGKIYNLARKHSNSTKKREFILKFFNQLTRTNNIFCIAGVKDSAKCIYCEEEDQTYFHLFKDCPMTEEIRKAVETLWFNGIELSTQEWFTGSALSESKDEKARGYIAMELNCFLYRCNWKDKWPTLKHFRAVLMEQERVEQAIASRNDKIMLHLSKWDAVRKWMGP